MALKIETEIDMNENSLDNSVDGDLLGMVDERSLGSSEGRSQVEPQYLDANEDESDSAYNFRDLSGSVTYKFVQMSGESGVVSNIPTYSPTNGIPADTEYYVIGDPATVFGTSAVPKKVQQRKPPLQTKAVTTKKRDDKRRATHNEVERRRRDKINSWITKLAALVPDSGLTDSASKGGILAKACDHITDLTEKQKRLEKMEADNDKLMREIVRLNQEMAELRKENIAMRSRLLGQIADTCIVQRPKTQKS